LLSNRNKNAGSLFFNNWNRHIKSIQVYFFVLFAKNKKRGEHPDQASPQNMVVQFTAFSCVYSWLLSFPSQWKEIDTLNQFSC